MTFTRACALSELVDSKPLRVEVDGLDVAVVKHGDEVFAIEDECSHGAVPLSEGDVEGCTLECFLHGSCFDLRTGAPSSPPASEPVDTYAVTIDGDDVYVDPTSPTNR